MTPKERAVKALNLEIPDQVPTFELEFQLEEEMFGRPFLKDDDLIGLSQGEREKKIKENAEYLIHVYEALEHAIIPIHYLRLPDLIMTVQHIKKLVGERFMITTHGDGTFGIPNGSEMEKFIYWLVDSPEEAKKEALRKATEAIERNKKLVEGGYIFTTSNIPFKRMRPERCQLILDTWKKHRRY